MQRTAASEEQFHHYKDFRQVAIIRLGEDYKLCTVLPLKVSVKKQFCHTTIAELNSDIGKNKEEPQVNRRESLMSCAIISFL